MAKPLISPSILSADFAKLGEEIRAIDDAGVNPEEVGYFNAHGTSTPVGDTRELEALPERIEALEGDIAALQEQPGETAGGRNGWREALEQLDLLRTDRDRTRAACAAAPTVISASSGAR